MKKILVLAGLLAILAAGMSFGELRQVAPYRGDPRINPGTDQLPGNAPGPGPFAYPGTAVFLDSSRNQNGIYISRVNGTSSNGSNIVGKVIRQYLTSSGILEAFTWTNGGRPPTIFFTDPNLNTGTGLRYPWLDFSAPETYGFVTASQVITTFDAPYYIRNSGGYGSGLWDAPVQIRPTGELYQNANGIWLGNSSKTICVPMEQGASPIALMSEIIDTMGNVVGPLQTIFDQNGATQDYRNGKILCFGGGPTDELNVKTSIDGGVTWVPDSITVYVTGPDSGWYEYNCVVLQDGSPGVLLTMDNVLHGYAGQHSAIQFFHKGSPKVTVFSPGPGQAAAFPAISRKADNTLVAAFSYVESGWDSVAWSNGRTFWDIGMSYSTNGGVTWSAVRNLTNTPTVGEGCPQMAKNIGTDNRLHMTFGTPWRTSQPSDTADLYWAVAFAGAQTKTYNYFFEEDLVGVEGGPAKTTLPATYELAAARPNPTHGNTAIQYTLPAAGQVNLAVYNAAGQLVKTLVSGQRSAGVHSAQWDGRGVSSGVYFYRLNVGTFTKTQTVVVVR